MSDGPKMRLVELFAVLAMAAGGVFAQGTSVKSNAVTTPSPNPILEDPRSLRRQELRILQDHVLAGILDTLKSMDEAALRMSARNELLSYFSGFETSEESKSIATKLVLDDIADFGSHRDEIPAFIANYLLGDLGAWIHKYHPELIEKFQAVEKAEKERDHIRSLIDLKDGDALAAQEIRQLFEAGEEVDGLVFYLDELMRRNSQEFVPLLSALVTLADRSPHPSLETLFWIKDTYFAQGVPKELKQRFLVMVVARTHPANFVVEPPSKFAYDLLTQLLPAIKDLNPELYERALTESFVLRSAFSERQLAGEARAKRLKDSTLSSL